MTVPGFMIPLFKTNAAAQRGVEKNLLFSTWGVIGDVICSEPTIRYALEKFKDCKITIATHQPEIFSHLAVHDVYDLRKEKPIEDDYLILDTIPVQNNRSLIPQFISHMSSNCVDFPALSSIRSQLPIENRNVILKPSAPTNPRLLDLAEKSAKHVYVHAGRHWKSKTFPTEWWNRVLRSIQDSELVPVLIGKHDGDTQGYVDVDPTNCIDLRDKTTLSESIWLLQQAPLLLCNDSSPLHMAVSGRAWVLFIASVKHPDFITHWRRPEPSLPPQWGWRMQNLGKGGVWDHIDVCPNRVEDVNVDLVDPKIIESILPDPAGIGQLCRSKIDDYFN